MQSHESQFCVGVDSGLKAGPNRSILWLHRCPAKCVGFLVRSGSVRAWAFGECAHPYAPIF